MTNCNFYRERLFALQMFQGKRPFCGRLVQTSYKPLSPIVAFAILLNTRLELGYMFNGRNSSIEILPIAVRISYSVIVSLLASDGFHTKQNSSLIATKSLFLGFMSFLCVIIAWQASQTKSLNLCHFVGNKESLRPKNFANFLTLPDLKEYNKENVPYGKRGSLMQGVSPPKIGNVSDEEPSCST